MALHQLLEGHCFHIKGTCDLKRTCKAQVNMIKLMLSYPFPSILRRIPLALHCSSQEKWRVAPCAQRLLAEDNLNGVSLPEDPEDPSGNQPNLRKQTSQRIS